MARGSRFFVWAGIALILNLAVSAVRVPAINASKQTGPNSKVPDIGYHLTDVTTKAGLKFRNYFGGETSKKYILETTGSGVAFFDYRRGRVAGYLSVERIPTRWIPSQTGRDKPSLP